MGDNKRLRGPPRLIIKTALFDKRQTEIFQGFVFNRFPHVTSALTDRAKLGIVVSQFHRFRRIISDYEHFITEMSEVIFIMIYRGYTRRSLMNKLRNVLRQWPHHLYHAQHGRRSNNKKVILDIKSTFECIAMQPCNLTAWHQVWKMGGAIIAPNAHQLIQHTANFLHNCRFHMIHCNPYFVAFDDALIYTIRSLRAGQTTCILTPPIRFCK